MNTVDLEEVQSDQEAIAVDINTAKSHIETGEAIKRLYANPDFIRVVGQDYFQTEAIRLVSLLADPSQKSDHDQEMLNKRMFSISLFQDYLSDKLTQAKLMENAMPEYLAAEAEMMEAAADIKGSEPH